MALNYDNLTDEQKALIEKLLYDAAKYKDISEYDDNKNFVIPFIAMNDGHTPAQIRVKSKGLYKDIQRAPFLRKTGVFSENNTIPDIDISPLVYYGTLEQSKIAPTLENIDVKLYYREPHLRKEPDNAKSIEPETYADTYIWRELPNGFHVYNNDTVYGYEWLVLQDDYVNTDGIYNLHMNIEDGLGCCKFAGTQAPINLAGVQYKIIITAKNLWNREFSLIDSMPLLHNLASKSDELAPTTNAVREYYEKALETLKVVTNTLYIGDAEDPLLSVGDDATSVVVKKLTLGEIQNLEEFLNTFKSDFQGHVNTVVDDATYDENHAAIGVHGIVNKGILGNLNAKKLDGLTLSNGQQAVVEDITDDYAFVPYVDKLGTIGLGTIINAYDRSTSQNPTLLLKTTLSKSNNSLYVSNTSGQTDLSSIVQRFTVGTTILNAKVSTIDNVVNLTLNAGNFEKDAARLTVDSVKVNSIVFNDSDAVINATRVAYWNGASSIAYKKPISELLNSKIKEANNGEYATLTPNIDRDSDGVAVGDLITTAIESNALQIPSEEDSEAFVKLGSALQALYELPLGTYEYKRGQDEYKTQIGIFVERVNQIRDKILELKGSGETESGVPAEDDYIVHKRNTLVQSSHNKVVDNNVGFNGTIFQERVDNNAYTYSDEEIKSISRYLNLTTSKKELAQEIRNTVGILLKAAKETQERLLDVETAVYGFDAKTVPGSDAAHESFINNHIAKDLQEQLNNSPLLLGLNRLMRAISLEIFDTTDLEAIDAEVESRVTDSDKLGEKVTIKSRMDQVDEIASVLYSQLAAVISYYNENVTTDEASHTYTDIVDKDDQLKITDEVLTEPSDADLLGNLSDDHSEEKDRDKGRAWKNLPAAEDVTEEAKQNVAFAQVSEAAHKHTPKAEESGKVRVPVVVDTTSDDYSEYNKDENSGVTNRTWDLFKLDKVKRNESDDYAAAGTYKPYFKTKAVAWDSAKLERINLKVSELTKTIYGTDDVTASLPNRTEVLRRNITNLVDDLYPNRSFAVEKAITTTDDIADIRLPFKASNIQTPEANSVVTLNTDETKNIENHISIIHYINNELFNFNVQNNYFGEGTQLLADYADNKQITLNNDTNSLIFSSSKLVTDETPFDTTNYGTYNKAYSRVDLLENVVGTKDCYVTDLYVTNILDAFNIKAANASTLDLLAGTETYTSKIQELTALKTQYDNVNDTENSTKVQQQINALLEQSQANNNTIPSYLSELEFKNWSKYLDYNPNNNEYDYSRDVLSSNIKTATNVGFVLSRKVKTIQERLTTLEAFADELSKGFNYINNLASWSETKQNTYEDATHISDNTRFEKVEAFDSLKRLGQLNENKKTEPLLFDLDLSESYVDLTKCSCFSHNTALWKVVTGSKDVKKTSYGVDSTADSKFVGSYTISGSLATDPSLLDSDTATKFTKGANWEIKVKYVKASTIYNDLEADADFTTTIYLIGKTPTASLQNFYKTDNTSSTTVSSTKLLDGANGWQNQTEYNNYKTLNNLFTSLLTRNPEASDNNLYYQLMLLAHPVGSIYEAMTNDNSQTPDKLFGGTWVELKDGYLLPSDTADNISSGVVTPNAATIFQIYEGVALKDIDNTGTDDLYIEGMATSDPTQVSTDQAKEVKRLGLKINIDNVPHFKIRAWLRTA